MSQTLQGIQDAGQPDRTNPEGMAIPSRPVILLMFSRRWLLPTVLVVIGVLINVRLGIWQLDRLEQRRAFNNRVMAQIDQPVLELTGENLDQDLASMEYRDVIVTGSYEFENEVALRNQAFGSQPGVHLLTPLHITGSDQVVLVNRGWVPIENGDFESWSSYPEPGQVTVQGMIRASQDKPDYGGRSDTVPAAGEAPLKVWYFANLDGISRQLPYPLLPVYIQQAGNPSWTGLPYRTQPELDLSEGPHQGYAIQWFTFAAILGIGYPFFIHRQERRRDVDTNSPQTGTPVTER